MPRTNFKNRQKSTGLTPSLPKRPVAVMLGTSEYVDRPGKNVSTSLAVIVPVRSSVRVGKELIQAFLPLSRNAKDSK
jgi:hypothetical protein